MTATKPFLLGYLRRELLVSEGQIEQVKQELARFAQVEGYTIGSTYVERPDTSPAAFEALIEAVNRYEVAAIVLPSLLHFAGLGAPIEIRSSFEHATGARVLVARQP